MLDYGYPSAHPHVSHQAFLYILFNFVDRLFEISVKLLKSLIWIDTSYLDEATLNPPGDPWSLVSRTRIQDDGKVPSEVFQSKNFYSHTFPITLETTLQVVTVSNTASTSRNNENTPSSNIGSSDGSEFSQLIHAGPPAERGSLAFPLHMIPVPKNPDFLNRANEIAQIDEAFFRAESRGEGNQTKTFAICGPGGMGKTQIAAAFVHSRNDRFDAIFWIHAASSFKLRDEFAQVAISLGLVQENSTDARDQVITRDLVKAWLANPPPVPNKGNLVPPSPASWLIVFDNVDDTQVLEGFLPLGSPGCVLFTSRDPTAKHSTFLATTGVDLQSFNERDASQLLNSLTKKSGDSSEAHKRIRGLPLAITQMAKVIVRLDLTYAEFVESYDEEVKSRSSDLLQADFPSLVQSSHYKETIWSVWAFESLKHSRSLLDILSVLDPDGIQESILIPPHAGNLRLLADFPNKKVLYQRARAELLQSSLITKDRSGKQLVIHRMVQDAARAKMSLRRFREVFSCAVSLVSSAWRFEEFGWRHTISRWKICEKLMPHVLQLHRFGEQINVEPNEIDTIYALVKLLTDAAW